MRILELRMTHRLSMHTAGAELAARDGRPPTEMFVVQRQVHVRKSRAAMQRTKAVSVPVTDVPTSIPVPVPIPAASAPSAPPGMEIIARAKGKPADRAPSPTKSKAAAPAVERNISRRPDGTIVRISVGRTRPPSPTSVNIHPTAVVIRRPAPVVVGNPGPAPIRLIHPAAIAIRSPIGVRLIWPPHWTVIRNFRPGAVVVEIFGSHVVVVSVPTRVRVADHVVAIGVPLIKVIPGRRFANLVLRLIAHALNSNELVLSDTRAALRSRNLHFAFADEHFRVIVGSHQNSKAGFAAFGANGNVGRIDFRIRVAVLEDGVVRHAAAKLNLYLRAGERVDVD